MKKMVLENGNAVLFVGTAREIKNLFTNINNRELAWCVFSDAPKFNMSRTYGLVLRYYDEYNEEFYADPQMCVVSAETALELVLTTF